jgi:hypothetical protein
MGTWTLERIAAQTSDHTTQELFGSNVQVTFWLRYRPSRMGRFVETPKLDWHEHIIMKEHPTREWWEFETNMYEHNPSSATLQVWVGRYYHAYRSATGNPDLSIKGRSELRDATGAVLPRNVLPAGITRRKDQVEAVRGYLKKHGGMLVITIHDIPSIRIRPGEHKERLLRFDCGLVGSPLRWRSDQYLHVDTSRPQTAWIRQIVPAFNDYSTAGFRKVPPPPQVSTPRAPMFFEGDCW